ncbi:hypothetical protein HU200_050627 [Digitaria exilis]|uniref:Uncharacterized protein n=1 Tax=Digitaria exilis TaxID=1010633 RepID=A0A835EB44_9POAL|nr:hypothetical protein HU200_050627 [Digitaria exilis]
MPGSLRERNTKGNEWIRLTGAPPVPLLSRRLLASLAPTRRLPLRTPSLPFTSLPPPSLPSSLSLSHSRRLPYRTPSLPSTSPSPPSLPAKTERAVLERLIRDAFTVPEHPRVKILIVLGTAEDCFCKLWNLLFIEHVLNCNDVKDN